MDINLSIYKEKHLIILANSLLFIHYYLWALLLQLLCNYFVAIIFQLLCCNCFESIVTWNISHKNSHTRIILAWYFKIYIYYVYINISNKFMKKLIITYVFTSTDSRRTLSRNSFKLVSSDWISNCAERNKFKRFFRKSRRSALSKSSNKCIIAYHN